MTYRPEIDGLRAFAVLPVIFFHAGFEIFSGGFVGVDVFFVISGYLITSIILADIQKGAFSIVHFYERRMRRILPALFLIVAVSIPVALLYLVQDDLKDFFQSITAVSVFSSNILFWLESGYFETAAELKPLLHTWSLAVEEQFYLLFPLFLIITWRLGKKWVVGLLSLVFITSLAAAQWGSQNMPEATFYLLPTRGWELCIGAFIAFYFAKKDRVVPNVWLSQSASLLGLLMIAYAVFAFDKNTPFPSLYALVPTVGAALIIVFATQTTLAGKLLGSKIFVGAGLISYSAYLWHYVLFAFARHIRLEEPGVPLLLALSAASLVLAYCSWRFVEQPFRRKGVIKRSKVFTFALIGSVSFFTIGLAGNFTDGFAGKFGDAQSRKRVELRKDHERRSDAVRLGKCHFNSEVVDIDTFLAQWNCKGDDSLPELKRIPLIVTGDSHSADKVMALEANGLLPLQIGGAGCSLVPSKMSNDCKKIYDKLYQEVKDDDYYEYLALSAYFTKDELTVEAIEEMIVFWKKFNKKIIFFTGMPAVPRLRDHLQKNLMPVINFRMDEMSKRPEIINLLKSAGVHIVDTKSIFCKINNCKFYVKDGTLLFVEDTHLSVTGARLFGKALIENDEIFRRMAQ